MKTLSPSALVDTVISYNSEEEQWEALCRRDAQADGRFFYAVKTTGVYCRPSCASRAPRRENVHFFVSAAEAARAGYRACKRCEPEGAGLIEQRASAVSKACHLMETSEDPPGLQALAQAAGMSRFHFHRVFRQVTGVTPKAYAMACRADRMRAALAERGTITEAIYEAGFNSGGRFYEKSSQMLGMAPSRFQKGGLGVVIRFAVGQCSLGAILVASSERGVCAILLGNDPNVLVQDLQDRFPRAQLCGGDADYEQVIAQVIGFIEAPKIGLNLPLDVRGTAFQQRVWKALQDIPIGTTTNYAEIANRLGMPKAFRAVARACASNAHAVAIPCHRVVRSDGGISGYRWGVERKISLLARESASGGPAREC